MKKFLPDFITDYANDYIKNHVSDCYFEINYQSNKLNFTLKNKIPFIDSYLMIRHRKTGKRILKKIQNSQAQISIKDINEFDELGVFDVYLRVESFDRSRLHKVKFISQNNDKFLIDYENSRIFEAYKNINANISFNYSEKQFYTHAYKFNDENNNVILTGEISLINKTDFDSIELRMYCDEKRIDIPCKFKQYSNKVLFECEINLDLMEDNLYDVFDIDIKIKKDNVILDQGKVNGYSLSNNSIVDGEFLGLFKNSNDLCGLFYLNYDYNIQFTILNKNDVNKFIRNKKSFYSFKFNNMKKPLVFFESFHGKFYSGQPKYIYEKMLELEYDKIFDFAWAYNGDIDIPGNPIYVRYGSKDYKSLFKNAKYLISNIDFTILKNDNQIYLQTTHGTPYKHMGADITSNNTKIKKGKVLLESDTWNYLLSANDYSKKTFQRAFEYSGKIINKGYPANDIFYQENQNIISELKNKFNIDKDKKIILYAPTFRDYDLNINFELLLDLKKFKKVFSDEYVMILRLHYLISENLKLDSDLDNFIIDLSNYDDVADLYLISDILITDYSSAFFDFAHSKKPILFYTPDFEKYSNFRGLYDEIKKDLPGKEFCNDEDLIYCIKNIDSYKKDYQEKYELFYNKYCSLGHGTSSEDVINIVFGGEKNE